MVKIAYALQELNEIENVIQGIENDLAEWKNKKEKLSNELFNNIPNTKEGIILAKKETFDQIQKLKDLKPKCYGEYYDENGGYLGKEIDIRREIEFLGITFMFLENCEKDFR